MPMARAKSKGAYKRPDPDIRPSRGGVLVDGIDEYSRAVMGEAPHDFPDLVQFAVDVLPVAAEVCGIDERAERPPDELARDRRRLSDMLLLAAWSLRAQGGDGEHPIAFVQRAKQVIAWCQPKKDRPPMLLEHLEAKGREIARIIGERLTRAEEFVLLIKTEGGGMDGHMTWLTSVERNTTIKLLDETLTLLREDQKGRS